jgi:uncharacterized membrane protein (UPF0127 family)
MRLIRRPALLLACLLATGLGARPAACQGITFNQAPLTLVTENGSYQFTVDVADNTSRIDLGLRYRHSVDPDGGLLILQSLAAPSQVQVTTEGLSLPIDLLFVASDGTVREVHPWVPTDSSEPISPTLPWPPPLSWQEAPSPAMASCRATRSSAAASVSRGEL